LVWRYVGALLTGVVIGFLGGLFGKGGSAVCDASAQSSRVPRLYRCCFTFASNCPEYGSLIDRVLALSVDRLGNLLVERWYRHTSDCWWLILISSGWFPPPSHSHRRAGSWLPYLLLVFPERPVPRDCHGPEPGGAEAVRLDSTDGERRNGGRLCFGLACERGGIPPGPVLTNILRQPMKKAFACSLAVSCILAMPGTIVHAYLGHISRAVAALVAAGAIPFAHLGARLAIATRAAKLERWYGMALTALGIFFPFQV